MSKDAWEGVVFASAITGACAVVGISWAVGKWHGEGWGLMTFGCFMLLACAGCAVAALRGGAK